VIDDDHGIRCMLMRGGTSKGAYFVASDLPTDSGLRDTLLLRIMGSPDPRQIDGIGGAHPLTSKVAVVSVAEGDDADLDYLFLQVGVDAPTVSDRQNCGNLLAGVAPFAVERGLVEVADGRATLRIRMVNTGSIATATFTVAGGVPVYGGATSISGVPGTASPVELEFDQTQDAQAALLPTGNVVDVIDGVAATLIDNGMPVVVMRADALDITGYETCDDLESNSRLRERLESIRLQAGELMGLGDVSDTTVPKLTMVAPPQKGGGVATRTFIPHRCHQAIGVLGAVAVATACLIDGTPASEIAEIERISDVVRLEHPSGSFDVILEMSSNGVERAGIVRTARKLMDGSVYPRQY